MPQYATINSIVDNALIDIGENTEHMYSQFLHWGLEALRDYSFDTSREIKTISLPMNPNKTVELPLDYVDYSKVGIVIGDRIKTFVVNNKIELRHDVDECGNPKPKETSTSLNSLDLDFRGGYWFNNFLGRTRFGYGGTCFTAGYCRVDNQRGQIVFSSEVSTTEVYLEYITNGMNPSGESTVNEYAAKVIKLYILWMRKENSSKFGLNQILHARNMYYNELRMVRSRLSKFSIQDFIEATRKGYLDNLEEPRFGLPDAGTEEEETKPIVEDCDDFPVVVPPQPPPGTRVIYWGASANEFIDTSEEILTLNGEFFSDRFITKTMNATGGKYIWFFYPVAMGQGTFIFNTFETSMQESIVSLTTPYGTEDYYGYRAYQLQHGENLTFKIT